MSDRQGCAVGRNGDAGHGAVCGKVLDLFAIDHINDVDRAVNRADGEAITVARPTHAGDGAFAFEMGPRRLGVERRDSG